MTAWRYTAIGADRALRQGELAVESAYDARVALRRMGLTTLELRPAITGSGSAWRPFWSAHLRRRRGAVKAEFFDGLATLLESGVPLTEALEAVATAARGRSRSMLLRTAGALRAGWALSGAARAERGWFDETECAVLEAGEHRGELAATLRSLGEQRDRTGELGARLAAALAYPTIVAAVGVGVVVFLSTRTLPQLTGILARAGVETPALTRAVIAAGSAIERWWWAVACAVVIAVLLGAMTGRMVASGVVTPPALARRLVPGAVRRLVLARLLLGLAELHRAGIPLVEALRVLARSLTGPVTASLRASVLRGAARLERGEDLSAALDDPHWFGREGAELRRLLAVGQASGELGPLVERLAHRYERSARRAIDRFAALLEPAVVLVLAAFIGLVVLGAVLPMIRLQEVIR